MIGFKRIAAIGLFAGGLLCGTLHADTVYLKNGTEVEGTVVEDNARTVSVRTASGATKSFRRAEVESVVYENKLAKAKPAEVPTVPGPATGGPDKPKGDDSKGAAGKVEGGGKPADVKKDDKGGDTKKEGDAKKGEDAKDDWTPPEGISGFPDHAKRMSKDKEKQFLDALEQLASGDEGQRTQGRATIGGLGADALPYVVTGIQHANVDARSICMSFIGQFGGKSATKQVIEVFYSAMPETGAPATWQVPFIREIKNTLASITGQSYITVEPKSVMVQNGLKQYIEWYNTNIETLPSQLGEKKLDQTAPDYVEKLKAERALKLAKKSWPAPAQPSDYVGGPNKSGAPDKPAIPPGGGERDVDKEYKDSYKKVDRGDALKRPQDDK
jgi:hypothetical protein